MAYGNDTAWQGPSIYTGTATALVPSINVKGAKMIAFTLSGLTTETVSLDISFDNNNWITGVRPVDLSTGAVASASTLASGSYSFGGAALPCAFFRLTKSGAANNATANVGVRL